MITKAQCLHPVCFRRLTTQLHLSSQPTCFVLDDCDDDSETFANIFDGKVSFSMEPTTQTSSTPIAFNAVDTGVENILDVHTADDDGPWSSEDEHKSDWNKIFKNGTYCIMLCGDVLRYYPKQVVSSIEAENAPANMREFLPWTQNTVTLTRRLLFLSAKQTNRHLLLRAQVGGFEKVPRLNKAQDAWHDSKTALNVATGSRSMSLTTHVGDIRRRS